MKHIIILGAGFAGLSAALGLSRRLKANQQVEIILIDQHDYFLFTPNLFEVAAAVEEFTSPAQLRRGCCLPLKEVLSGTKVKFVKGKVKAIDPKDKKVFLENRVLDYSYVVLALGSTTEYFGVEGAPKYVLSLGGLKEALSIRNQIGFAIQLHRQDAVKKNIRVVIIGGGYAGVELVGELAKSLEIIAWKNQYPKDRITLELIEGANRLISGFDERVGRDALIRLKDLGVRVRLLEQVFKVEEHFVHLLSGERLYYDVLLWTGGRRGNSTLLGGQFELDKKGKIKVNRFLQTYSYSEVFAIGDVASVVDASGQPAALSAQDAWDQAKYLAAALPKIMQNQRPFPYSPARHGCIVNVGGKWAIMSYKGFYLKGFLAYVVDRLAHLHFYAFLVGWWKATKYVFFEVSVYGRND